MEPVSNNEVIGNWVKREWDNLWSKFGRYYPGKSKEDFQFLVENPNYSREDENYLRTLFLTGDRVPLLLPCWDANWYKTELSENIFKELRVIHASGWLEISIDAQLRTEGKLSEVANNVFNKRINPFSNRDNRINYQNMRNSLPTWEESRSIDVIDTHLILLQSEDEV